MDQEQLVERRRIVEVGIRDTIFCGDFVACEICALSKFPRTGSRPPSQRQWHRILNARYNAVSFLKSSDLFLMVSPNANPACIYKINV